MYRVLTAVDICHRALRAIGKFPVTDSAPDGENLREAMTWLDLILAEIAGTERVFSRLEETLSMAIENGTGTYDLYDTLGDDLPDDGIQFIVDVWIEDGNGNRSPIEIVTREKFEDVSRPAETGTPCWLHNDLIEGAPTVRIYPTPDEDDPTEWTLKLVCQRFAPNVAPGGVTGTAPVGGTLHRMGQAWQRFLTFQLAHDLACGPIHKLPEASIARFERAADRAKQRLLAFTNREHQTTPPVCLPWGLD